MATGAHPLDLGVKAVVSEYETRPTNELRNEAHLRYIDIQFAVIGDGYFLLVFPEDVHEPGLAPGGECGKVKKVVMKVPVGSGSLF